MEWNMFTVSLTTNITISRDGSTYRNIYMIEPPRNYDAVERASQTHSNSNAQVETMHIKMTCRLAFRNSFALTKF